MHPMPTARAKTQPTRMCVTCRSRLPKTELLRVVRTAPGEAVFVRQGKRFGRTAYLCPALSCIEQARRKHLVERSLNCDIGEQIWAELAAAGRADQG
jgi:hypothetical protein